MHRTAAAGRFLVITLSTLALAACATRDQNRMADAATAPLTDLNVVQAKIPAVLLEARKQPYRIPQDSSCLSLSMEVAALDDALGPDHDAPAPREQPDLLDKGTEQASRAAADALRRTTEGVLPFRSWVRKLTGAERHSRKVTSAVAAGTSRRAFLKGLQTGQGCPLAAPATVPDTPSTAASAP